MALLFSIACIILSQRGLIYQKFFFSFLGLLREDKSHATKWNSHWKRDNNNHSFLSLFGKKFEEEIFLGENQEKTWFPNCCCWIRQLLAWTGSGWIWFAMGESSDPRLDFIQDFTLKSLRLKPDKWARMVVSDEQVTTMLQGSIL